MDHDTLTNHDDTLMPDRVDTDGTAVENEEHGKEAIGAGAGALGGAAVDRKSVV